MVESMRNFANAKIFFALLPPVCLLAQSPANKSEVKIDNAQVHVIAATEQPGQATPLHEHKLNRVMVYLDSGTMIEKTAAGKTHKIAFKAGEVRWSPAAGPHTSEFIASHPVRLIEIELKNHPSGPPPTSALDPLKVDAKNYSMVFENDQVRVLRVRFGPHENGVEHEHTLPHVVVYLTDQARGKAGEVKWDQPMKHTESNPLDHAVERIAIDIK
jgi:quercetin dioxygenase-like cupin family protein